MLREKTVTIQILLDVYKRQGSTGYSVVTYRNVYDGNGELISSNQEATSYYSKRDKVVLVPVKPEEPEQPVESPDPSTEPTDPPTEPTDPPAEPTDPPTEPTDPPAEPTDPSTEVTPPPPDGI